MQKQSRLPTVIDPSSLHQKAGAVRVGRVIGFVRGFTEECRVTQRTALLRFAALHNTALLGCFVQKSRSREIEEKFVRAILYRKSTARDFDTVLVATGDRFTRVEVLAHLRTERRFVKAGITVLAVDGTVVVLSQNIA